MSGSSTASGAREVPTLGVTPTQTVGPFFAPALLRDPLNTLTTDGTEGERIRVEGRVLDGAGAPVPDAMIEIWQANAHGRFNHPRDTRELPLDPEFTGWGRSGTDDTGLYWFETVKPGPVPFDGGTMQAPHLSVTIHARGMLNHAQTRLYFGDEDANAADPILALVPSERRQTLIAARSEEGGRTVYRLDIILQGPGEIVYFNI
ncbi:MAG: protocatechuate 3,4-dioxygenase subunit alpha [Chloroflexi bacterium]|nr:protocatechuate 3,4-dioxygenase subunit alpha [Chloroflexota bacterium]